MRILSKGSNLQLRLEIHDRKQFEIKLEYKPSTAEGKSKYTIESYLFLPASLNINSETYPRSRFYSDIHNYVRIKTPVQEFDEILRGELSPLMRFEQLAETLHMAPESQCVYDAKLVACVFRGALRRSLGIVRDLAASALTDGSVQDDIETGAQLALVQSTEVLTRFRDACTKLMSRASLNEKTRASLRLVDEYLSLLAEQLFRKAVADMERLPRTQSSLDLRKAMLALVIAEERWRKENKLSSVLSPSGDNEEYMHRLGFLKKFCMNILFLSARRDERRHTLEELAFASAAGLAMAFATLVLIVAGSRFGQNSLNFFLIVVVSYMMKDRMKEGLRQIFGRNANKFLYDRGTEVLDPVTQERVAVCREKVDFGRAVAIPPEIETIRRKDSFIPAAEGELSETVMRYHKRVVLNAEHIPKVHNGVTGVTDIIRFNVDYLLRDMDDPEFNIEYIDLEDFSVGRIKGAKRYQVDLALRIVVEDGGKKDTQVELVRLVLDREGIKRLIRLQPELTKVVTPTPMPAVH